ncbi:MAG: PD-(D/E)XK nuclease family protein [Saprospiraceae bacterium]|nr:PD-(D/E)XK nuclease family protein [Saprospiraceae bacterium]
MQVRLTFGLQLDNASLPLTKTHTAGLYYLGPKGFLNLLESYLGLSGHPSDLEYLRVENYRQALFKFLQDQPDAFFARSFQADQFGTAQELLSRRDELLMNGWDFQFDATCPSRLQAIAQIEIFFSKKWPGYADRFVSVLQNLSTSQHPIREIQLCEPFELLPYPFQRLLHKLESHGCVILPLEEDPISPAHKTDLDAFRNILFGNPTTNSLKGDGSLIILKGKRASELASFLAQFCRKNPDFQPFCLIPERNRALDNAFIQEGLPAMGLESASLARPVLQILKLAPAFLWDPIDPYKVLEFVNLALKPLDDDLANAIAGELAQTPGLDSDNWKRTIARAFDLLEARHPNDPKRITNARNQYAFWFRRKNRYPIDEVVPKKEVIELFSFIQNWASDLYEPETGKNKSLLVLGEQAKRIREILEALPEKHLTHLEVERIVRTIYEPAPIVFQAEQQDRLEHVYHPGAITQDCNNLLWWNFVQTEPVHFFSKWYHSERQYLEQIHIHPESPESENQRRLWFRKRPLKFCKQQLILIAPESINGESTIPHPLMGDLEAAFGDLSSLIWTAGNPLPFTGLDWDIPEYENQTPFHLGKTDSFVQIKRPNWLNDRRKESFTSLESLFYYPYQWVFRYQLKLRKSSILSVVPEETLMGNLAHRMFELLFQNSIKDWNKQTLEAWLENQFEELLSREGAVLLLYGREPQRISFLSRLKFAAWSLVSSLQANNWEILESEKELLGPFGEIEMRGVADLIIKRQDELAVLDLKWRGFKRRSAMIRNEEDLQLILYSLLLTQSPSKAHTAFYIISDGKLVARDNAAFTEVQAVQPDADRALINQEILNRMLQTFKWRMDQLESGTIEIRCSHTQDELEDYYADQQTEWESLLEMRTEDAYYDDYRTLLKLF